MSRNSMPTWIFALIAAIFWLVCAGFVALGRHDQAKSSAFMSVARPATGTFVGYVVWHEKDSGLSSRKLARTIPEIEFETESGQKVRFAAVSKGNTLLEGAFKTLGSRHPVLYDPNNPSRAQLDVGLDKVFWLLYGCAALCAILALVFTILWVRRLRAV